MFGKKYETSTSSPSPEGGVSKLQGLPAESQYHDIDVFGREDDHEVCYHQFAATLIHVSCVINLDRRILSAIARSPYFLSRMGVLRYGIIFAIHFAWSVQPRHTVMKS